jgi:hypothetical protein
LYEKLPKQFGFEPTVDLDEEIVRMFELFLTDEVRARIEQRKTAILPRTWWSGIKRQVEQLELLNLEAEIRDDEQLYTINE